MSIEVTEKARRLLQPEVLAKLKRLDLVARSVAEGYVTGLHKSPFHGYSVEFAEHREYTAGDDLKHLDWKVFGRTDRYYIKQYEEETNLTAALVVDASESMAYKGPKSAASKLEYATWTAASLAYLALGQRDAVSLTAFDADMRFHIPRSQHPGHLKLLLHKLSDLVPQGQSKIGGVLHQAAERSKRKGLFIIISDLLDDPRGLAEGLQHLRFLKHEVIVFHVLDHEEIAFRFDDAYKMEGLEGQGELIVDAAAIRKGYLEELHKHLDAVKAACRQTRSDYVLLDTSKPLDVALSRYLATRSEVKLK